MKLLAIGDSNASGDSFVAQAAQAIGAELIDRGVPGERVHDLAARVERDAEDADIAVLLVGTNDMGHLPWGPILGNVRSTYPQILRVLKARCRRVVVCTVPPWSNGHETYLVRAMNGEILRACIGEGDVEIFDTFALLVGTDGKAARSEDFNDAVHFSKRGKVRCGMALALQLLADPVHAQPGMLDGCVVVVQPGTIPAGSEAGHA